MKDVAIKNVEEMTNKLIEYIWAVEDNPDNVEIDMLMVAAKFVITSMVKRGEEGCSATGDDILSR